MCGKPCAEQLATCEFRLSRNRDYNLLIAKVTEIEEELQDAFANIMFKPVVYDEIEYFSNGNVYPFKRRKNSLDAVKNFPIEDVEGKTFQIHNLQLKKNVVCYDSDIFSELFFWQEEKCDTDDTTGFDYQKIKFSQHKIETQPVPF